MAIWLLLLDASVCNYKRAIEYHKQHMSRAGEGGAHGNLGNVYLGDIQRAISSTFEYCQENRCHGRRRMCLWQSRQCLSLARKFSTSNRLPKGMPIDCLQSPFSLKIRLVLISSSAIANHDVFRFSQVSLAVTLQRKIRECSQCRMPELCQGCQGQEFRRDRLW